MDGEIRVALPVALLGVGEPGVPHHLPVHHLLLPERQGAQRLREQRDLRRAHRHLARPRAEERPLDADDVADVQRLHQRPTLLAQRVAPEVELDPAARVGEMREGGLAMAAPGDEPAGHAHHLAVRAFGQGGPRGGRRHRGVRPLVAIGVRRDAAREQLVELLAPRLHHEVEVVRAHAALPAAPNRFRYASMNGSIAPSITLCTSVCLSSVRWSLTIVYGWKT